MTRMAQRPLMFTVEHQEEFDNESETYEGWFILRANGREVYRHTASLSSDTDDAEEWAANLFFTVIDAALKAQPRKTKPS